MSKKILFYDTETTGLPNWKIPSGDISQPHIVQIGAILCDSETEEIIKELDIIIKPDDWAISQEMTDIHGISHQQALKEGIPEIDAIWQLLSLCGYSLESEMEFCQRAAHNRTFDQRIIRIALKRYPDFSDMIIDKWAEKDEHFCTMLMSKPIMELPPKRRFGWKNPNLGEAYKHFTGAELVNAHSALPDAKACMKIYFAMKKLKGDK